VGCWRGYLSGARCRLAYGYCYCHSLSLASVKSRLVLPFWYRLTWVVPEKGPLNRCVCVSHYCMICASMVTHYVPVSVTSRRCVEPLGGSTCILAWRLPLTCLTLCCKDIKVSTKNMESFLNFVLDSGLRNFAVECRSCFQQNSSTVELVDRSYGGQCAMDGRSMLYTHCAYSL